MFQPVGNISLLELPQRSEDKVLSGRRSVRPVRAGTVSVSKGGVVRGAVPPSRFLSQL